MSDPHEFSSKGMSHRELSERLLSRASEGGASASADASSHADNARPYASFRRRVPSWLAAEAQTVSAEALASSDVAGPATPSHLTLQCDALRSWQEFVECCVEAFQARFGYVVDHHGLPVASTGEGAQQAADACGALVRVALDQARKMNAQGRRVEFPGPEGQLAAFLSGGDERDALALILSISRPLAAAEAEELLSALDVFHQRFG